MPGARIKKKISRRPYVSVVLPVFNEEDNIRLQYEEITKAMKPLGFTYEIIFIDDGSTDLSPAILEDIASSVQTVPARGRPVWRAAVGPADRQPA